MLTIFRTLMLLLAGSTTVLAESSIIYPHWTDSRFGLLAQATEVENAADTITLDTDPSNDRDCDRLKYEITLFDSCAGEDSDQLWRQTKVIAYAGVGVAGFIYLLPEDISNWDRSEIGRGNMLSKWWENVSDGPVWDGDKWYINYVGHPYFGGVYYQVARKAGFNQWNSFVYSALMSTFYWEYGLEAFAEIPSIQDLVVTPVGGWLYGEWAHHKEKEIVANGGYAMGSRFWGDVALFLLDPVGRIDEWVGSDDVEVSNFGLSYRPPVYSLDGREARDGYWQFSVTILF